MLKKYLLPPAYVVRWEGNSFTLLVCLHPGGGGSVSQLSWGGGSASQQGGWVSWWGGASASGGGVSQPAGGGQLAGGVSQQGGSAIWWGGEVSQDRTTEWVLTRWRVVCPLRSRRSTFLLCIYLYYIALDGSFYILKQRVRTSRLYFNKVGTNVKFQVTFNILDNLWNPHVSLHSKIGYEVNR